MLNPIPNVRGSGYDVIKKLRFRERKFALFFKHELPPPDYLHSKFTNEGTEKMLNKALKLRF